MSINIAVLWHMHQPYYYDPLKGKFMLPWVRLHATKDYLDMLLILKNFPKVKVTFNVVPSLLKQLMDYERGITDIFFEYSLIKAEDLSLEQKIFIIENFFLANWDTMVKPFRRYAELLEKRGKSYGNLEKIAKKFTPQDIRDLQVLFNLTWIDPLHRNEDPVLIEIIKKGRNFSEEEKSYILDKHLNLMRKIIPTYREMFNSGQIELSVTPFYHPILPLLCDNYKAKECMPWVTLPENNFRAPEDAETQIKKAIDFFEETFGSKPKGMWPSEGSVSEEVIRLINKAGIKWIATDEEILEKSLGVKIRHAGNLIAPDLLYRTYNFEGVDIFFRDHVLSDLIGFVYSRWDAKKAVDDFIGKIKKSPPNSIVSVILDGENAWEYYENDGFDFLNALYEKLQNDKELTTVTFSEYLSVNNERKSLSKVFPGSWINANFSIWIGHEEDNLSWDYLYKTRQELIKFRQENPQVNLSEAWEEIYIAEGSDWNWWYGDEHYTDTKDVFDEIYRHHLMSVYLKIGKEPPDFLHIPISKAMREIKPELEPKGFIYPKIDGKVTGYFEWLEAGKFNLERLGGSMHRSESLFSYLYYGFNRKSLFIRLDPRYPLKEIEELKINIVIFEPRSIKITYDDFKKRLASVMIRDGENWIKKDEIDTVAYEEIVEIELPFDIIEIKQEENICFLIEILKNSYIVEKIPFTGFIKVHVPTPDFDKLMWL
ncbi:MULTISPECIES: glycoside hydrolase family 57 protein [Thermodesulfovibrio]|jgi:alpha-amylase/alpha-mannosidase (GH57 family)|uniref:glycoside hydrolase family 57 protein n=1 Tax=Thermodesulfovibrio TaxID=28261 RepID=UPI00262477C8|nr:glycoside hydrolase family 57 protein [Thermodesulfovibrio sp.]